MAGTGRDTSRYVGKKIDVDTHFNPRIDIDELRAELPRQLIPQAMDMLDREAQRVADPKRVRAEIRGEAEMLEPPKPDPWRDLVPRLQEVKPLGFDYQVLIPDGKFGNTHGVSPYTVDESIEIRSALCRLFNNVSSKAQKDYPDDVIGTMIVPFDNVPIATQEIIRGATELDLGIVVIPFNWIGKNFDEPELYPFWQAINDLRVTVFVHGITQGCGGAIGDHRPKYPAAFAERMRRLHLGTYMGFGLEYIMAAGSLTLGGVFDEFPNLRMCFFEAGASWLTYAMYACDRSFLIEPQCSRSATLPSELLKKHCLTAIEPMENIAELVAMHGSENYFFGTDFPHPEFLTFHGNNRAVLTHSPGASAILDRSDLSELDKENILGSNIVRFLTN